MEEAPAMDTQQTAAEQPADAALPAAETAAETSAPIAAPPGVPKNAPPPSLLTKEEPKENGKGSWRRGNNYWDRSSSSRDPGKGSHSQWDDYRRPASSRIDYAGPKDRTDKWWKTRDFEEYDSRFDDLVQDSTRRRREDDRQQEGRHTRQRGRGLDDPTLFFPCKECMALAGTNTSCNVCHYKYQTHLEKLKKSQSLPNLAKSPQAKLPSFPCPFPLNEEAELCDGGQAPSFYGHGKCDACKALRMYYVRLYGGDDAEAINPYHHTLIVGYERSIIEYLFALSSLLEWFRLLVYVLLTQWEQDAPLMKTKIYHWYEFTNGVIHNWSCFTVQSVEAFFQTTAPQLRPPFLGASVRARRRAALSFALVVLLFACTKSECSADIDLPRTWNAN